jgi:hypothetical protein
MPYRLKPRSASAAAAVTLATTLTLALAACGGSVIDGSAGGAPVVSHHGCVDDSKACIDQRQASLRTLQSDRSRGWVRQPASVNSYATGVRMFAFKTEKTRLTCDELAVGRREAEGAPGVLRSSQAQGLGPATVSRSLMFAHEVGRELDREQQRRCAPGGLRRTVN